MFAIYKILGKFITYPGLLITFLWALSLYALIRKRERKFAVFTFILGAIIYISSMNFTSYVLSKLLAVWDSEDKGGYIVVLGGGVDVFDDRVELGKHTMRRVMKAFELYKNLPRKVVVTGGAVTRGIPEANVMAQVLVDLGVDPSDIIVETKARNTVENARYTFELIGNRSITLVTSVAHMRRALKVFKTRFNEVYHVSADLPIDFRNTYLDYIPTAEGCYTFSILTHELMGLLKEKIFIRSKTKGVY